MNGTGILTDILKLCDKNSADTGYRSLALIWFDLVLKDIQNRQQNYHWRFLEVKGAVFDLTADDFDYAFATILPTTKIDTTKAIHVYDKFNDVTYKFVPYERFRELIADEAETGGDPYIFSLYADNLLLWPVPDYTAITGTADATTVFKLRDSTATFITDGVMAGMRATDTVSGLTAMITAVDSEIQLTVDTDIFIATDTYSIKQAAYIDYVKLMSDAADSSATISVPDKFKAVVYDGILKYAYSHDKELGDAKLKSAEYEGGIDKMKGDNTQIIAENVVPVSHRSKLMPTEQVGEFPLANTNI